MKILTNTKIEFLSVFLLFFGLFYHPGKGNSTRFSTKFVYAQDSHYLYQNVNYCDL